MIFFATGVMPFLFWIPLSITHQYAASPGVSSASPLWSDVASMLAAFWPLEYRDWPKKGLTRGSTT